MKDWDHIRIGQGVDMHPLVEGGPLCLGGVAIPFGFHLKGHSDGDVVAHAIADALLSASGLPELGEFLPDKDPENAGISGVAILEKVAVALGAQKVRIINIDCSVICDRPALFAYREAMDRCLAGALDISPGRIRIKPRHAEGLGFAGAGQGIVAMAVACVYIQPASPDVF